MDIKRNELTVLTDYVLSNIYPESYHGDVNECVKVLNAVNKRNVEHTNKVKISNKKRRFEK